MTNVDEVSTRFDAARDSFEIEDGQPTEAYITRLEETIGGILFSIRYDAENAKDNLIGLVLPDADYLLRFGQAFVRPTRPTIYDD